MIVEESYELKIRVYPSIIINIIIKFILFLLRDIYYLLCFITNLQYYKHIAKYIFQKRDMKSECVKIC